MDSQAPVLPRALKTNPDPICHTNPLRIKSPTLKTKLKRTKNSIICNPSKKNKIWLLEADALFFSLAT